MHGLKRRRDLAVIEEAAKTGDLGVPLPEDLVGDAAFAHLVFQLRMLVGPVGLHETVSEHAGLAAGVERRQHAFVGEVDVLDEPAAVEQLVVDVFRAVAAKLAAGVGEILFAKCCRHFRGGQQRRHVDRAEPGIRVEQLHIEGLMLAARQHAGLLRIPAVRIVLAPGIFNGAPDLWPVALQPFGIA